ncbi:MAG: MFS transporter [Deltaproteobacteria bacterium]|nr:MFS transporter [Deltaproteobacteria bacterium]
MNKAQSNGKSTIFYGYFIVAASFIMMMTTYGLMYSFGVFFKPLIEEFGWARANTSGAYSVMTFISGAFGVYAGRLSDRFGPRIIAMVIGVSLCLGCLLLANISKIWQFYLVYALILPLGPGACWPGLIPSIARWFNHRRGLMTGIVASGIGFGIFAVSPLAEWTISAYHWRKAYVIIGVVALILILIIAQFLRRDPYQMGLLPYGENGSLDQHRSRKEEGSNVADAVRTRPFILLIALYSCYGYCFHTYIVHIVPHAIDIGISKSSAAYILAFMGFASLANRAFMGALSDRIGIRSSLVILFSLLIVSQAWTQFSRSLWMLCLSGLLFGTAYGGIMSLQALVVAELFGLRAVGTLIGAVTCSYASGGALGPWISGYLFDVMHSYQSAFVIAYILTGLCFIFSILLKKVKKTE